MAVQLRDYRPSDFDAIWQLDQICFADDISYSRAEMRMYLALRTAFAIIAEEDGQVAGFTLVDARPQRPAYVVTIDVAPEYRKRGVAAMLLRETESRLRKKGVQRIRLEVAVDNEPAIAFYRKHGFHEIGRKAGYYGGRLDAICMRKELEEVS